MFSEELFIYNKMHCGVNHVIIVVTVSVSNGELYSHYFYERGENRPPGPAWKQWPDLERGQWYYCPDGDSTGQNRCVCVSFGLLTQFAPAELVKTFPEESD